MAVPSESVESVLCFSDEERLCATNQLYRIILLHIFITLFPTLVLKHSPQRFFYIAIQCHVSFYLLTDT